MLHKTREDTVENWEESDFFGYQASVVRLTSPGTRAAHGMEGLARGLKGGVRGVSAASPSALPSSLSALSPVLVCISLFLCSNGQKDLSLSVCLSICLSMFIYLAVSFYRFLKSIGSGDLLSGLPFGGG